MSKKVNPIIFRVGLLNQWSSKFIENKNTDLAFYIFYFLELKTFFKRFFKKYNLNVINLKYYFNKNSVSLYINYENKNKNNLQVNKFNTLKKNYNSLLNFF